MIKVEPEYFQELIVSSCRAHFAVLENALYFIFSANRQENCAQNKPDALFELFRRVYAMEENDKKKQKRK